MKKIVILLFAQLMVTGCPNRDPGSFGNVAVIDGTDAGTDAGMWECTDGLIGSWEFTYTETDWEVRGATRCGEKETGQNASQAETCAESHEENHAQTQQETLITYTGSELYRFGTLPRDVAA